MIYRYDNPGVMAGHVRLFNSRQGGGWYIYTYNRLTDEYPLHRCWNFGLFTIWHVSHGAIKKYGRPGWSISFIRIEAKRIYGGFSVSLRKPERWSPPQ